MGDQNIRITIQIDIPAALAGAVSVGTSTSPTSGSDAVDGGPSTIEIWGGTDGFRAYDIHDLVTNESIGKLFVTGANFTPTGEFNALEDLWFFPGGTAVFPDRFVLNPIVNATPPGTLGTGLRLRFASVPFVATSTTNVDPSVANSTTWRLTRIEAKGPVTLDAFVQNQGAPVKQQLWWASASSTAVYLNNRFLLLGEPHSLRFDRIAAAPAAAERYQITLPKQG